MIEAVIFDMDGLMYNTEKIFKPVFQKVAKDTVLMYQIMFVNG